MEWLSHMIQHPSSTKTLFPACEFPYADSMSSMEPGPERLSGLLEAIMNKVTESGNGVTQDDVSRELAKR